MVKQQARSLEEGSVMSLENKQISEYLNKTRLIVLATISDGRPVLRTMAAFAADGISPVFSTHKGTDKVWQIDANPHVSILFEHENQSLRTFVNITISGIARRIDSQQEREQIITLIGTKNLRYRERELRGELVEQLLYRVEPHEIKIMDFRKSPSPQGIQKITICGAYETAHAA
jgi:nitroimidazol reductase NimA-like FMN-containing flavoprotein (pyridoxamine 5'-phosphate oxidase superfamily)